MKQVVWITGASSGIGRALALEYNKAGYHCVISARRESVLQQVRAAMSDPEGCTVLALDLAKSEEASQWVAQVLKNLGRVDILINNGGMGHLGTAAEMDLQVERRVMEVNLWGAVALTKALLPHFIARGSGQIWTVASILGFFGSPKLAAYAASKFAVVGYFESLQYELRGTGVHVGLLSPGFINTEVTLSSLGPDGKPIGKNSVAQEKGMAPAELARKFLKKSLRRKPAKHVIIGRYEVFSVPFKRWFPGLFFKVYGKLTDITRSKK